jgi:hypothetical protein
LTVAGVQPILTVQDQWYTASAAVRMPPSERGSVLAIKMAEGSPQQDQLYSIVVVGAMNPRLHHPAWYLAIGAVTPEETAASLSTSNIIIVATHSQMDIAGCTVVCQMDRWEIRTSEERLRPRILEITSQVFAKLNETPVNIYGLNTKLHRPTRVPDVKLRLAEMLVRLDLGLAAKSAKGCGISFSNAFDTHSLNVEITPSPLAENLIHVGVNTEYQPHATEGEIYFDLGRQIREHFDADYTQALEVVGRVVSGINAEAD